MRSRSNSGVKLDNYARIIQKSILKFQDPITGLFSSSKDEPHAWVRDNLYSIQAVWGLALAYRKHADLDEDKAKAYELEQSVVKCMRSLLQCMIRQADKVEKFKDSQLPIDSLHAKYDARTCATVVGDHQWGHLQLDATGFFVLMLAQMTASGLSIIYTLDEVAFIQNLAFYIGFAYRTPDYGIWERGDKTNHGFVELNASSIGMCKAALEAIDELNLFGPSGGPQSVIHVTPDGKALCNAVLESLLPRESNSKEIDAGLLSIIGYPAFAVNDISLVNVTKQKIVDKLQGRYGCCRFLRDGYKTAAEDPSRLHYELAELHVFENIECEWPVFWTYFILDGIFNDNKQQVDEYNEALGEILVKENEVRCVPELYTVPKEKIDLERTDPHSQDRTAIGKLPHLWGQSLYMLSQMMQDGFLAPGEIDPLNRRFSTLPKPDVVVQVAIVAEEPEFKEMLMNDFGIQVETRFDIRPIQVQSAKVLSNFYSKLGQCKKLKLSGRPKHQIGILGTSKVYLLRNMKFIFTPNFLDQHNFYMTLDIDMLIDIMTTELQYLASNWSMPGRPILVLPLHRGMLNETEDGFKPSLLSTFRKIQSGYLHGVRVILGKLTSFMNTACITRLSFLESRAESDSFVESLLDPSQPRLFRLGSIVDSLKPQSPLILNDNHEKLLEEAKPHGITHLHKRISNDLTNSSLYKRSLRKQSSKRAILERYADVDNAGEESSELTTDNLLNKLKGTTVLREQADILQYLFLEKGGDWDTAIDGRPGALLRDLIEELYDKAGRQGNWMVIRQMTGLLRKRANGLSQAITDLLVRQKQVTVGFPQEPNETTITKPIPSGELHAIIIDAFGDDVEIAMLTQEIIIYLSMFMKSTPALFNDLFRLRVGLIIQVMASELAQHLQCSGEDASFHLMSLSPYEMKQLIHFILSGKEFGIVKSVRMNTPANFSHEISLHIEKSYKADKSRFVVLKKRLKQRVTEMLKKSRETIHQESGLTSPHVGSSVSSETGGQEKTSISKTLGTSQMPLTYSQFTGQKRGQWVRRRRIDGALNRVPPNFYSRIWRLLEKCLGICIKDQYIPGYVTKEMTPEELKFALLVENVLNNIPQPEYRQLVVEALIVLTLLADTPSVSFLSDNLNVDKIVLRANDLFYEDETQNGADKDILEKDSSTNICAEFYDCAPSGPYGTMTYLSKAVADNFSQFFPESVEECVVS